MNNKNEIEKVLTKRIINNSYRTGDNFPTERELAEEFNVSKTVIHEVMLSMRAKGFLSNQNGTRNQISSWVEDANMDIFQALVSSNMECPTYDMASDFAEFRVFNEGKCAALAAQNRTEEDLEKMRLCIDRLEKVGSREEFAKYLTLFHHLIFNATRNKLYAILFGSFTKLIEQWAYQMFPDWKDYDTRSLRAIYMFIEDRNAIKAECIMTAYTTKEAARLTEISRSN